MTAVSVITVTENRAAFLPWVAWNVLKQSYRPIQWIVVDSSPKGNCLQIAHEIAEAATPVEVIFRSAAEGATIGRKMNVGLRDTTGDLVIKMDDDDWQHPDRITRLVQAWNLAGRPDIVGSRYAGFLHLEDRKVAPYQNPRPPHSLVAVRRDFHMCWRWEEHFVKHEDSDWLGRVRRMAAPRETVIDEGTPLALWLTHGTNTTQGRRNAEDYRVPLAKFVAERIGFDAWGDSGSELEALALRLLRTRKT